jgi:hypothetical protein
LRGPRLTSDSHTVVRMRGARPESTKTTIELPPLCVRADVAVVDDEARTVEVTFSTGAPVVRYDWMTGTRYIERLSLKKGDVRLDRLNSGAPLLDSHSSWSVSDQIGVVEDGTASVNGKEGRAVIRFSKREAVDPIWQDVRDRVLRKVSVGYRVYTFEEVKGKDNALPVRTATDWEPFEISMTPLPADNGAQVRGEKPHDTNPCALVTRAQETPMDPEQIGSEHLIADNPLQPRTDRLALEPTDPPEPNLRDEGVTQERARVQGITRAVRAARLPISFADKLIA